MNLKKRSPAVAKYVVPMSLMRYPTAGDWWWENDTLVIVVADTGDQYMNYLVGMHEEHEAMVCLYQGIDEHEITEFDKKFEAERSASDRSEPGDHKDAPYRHAHFLATNLERIASIDVEVDWLDYETVVNAL